MPHKGKRKGKRVKRGTNSLNRSKIIKSTNQDTPNINIREQYEQLLMKRGRTGLDGAVNRKEFQAQQQQLSSMQRFSPQNNAGNSFISHGQFTQAWEAERNKAEVQAAKDAREREKENLKIREQAEKFQQEIIKLKRDSQRLREETQHQATMSGMKSEYIEMQHQYDNDADLIRRRNEIRKQQFMNDDLRAKIDEESREEHSEKLAQLEAEQHELIRLRNELQRVMDKTKQISADRRQDLRNVVITLESVMPNENVHLIGQMKEELNSGAFPSYSNIKTLYGLITNSIQSINIVLEGQKKHVDGVLATVNRTREAVIETAAKSDILIQDVARWKKIDASRVTKEMIDEYNSYLSDEQRKQGVAAAFIEGSHKARDDLDKLTVANSAGRVSVGANQNQDLRQYHAEQLAAASQAKIEAEQLALIEEAVRQKKKETDQADKLKASIAQRTNKSADEVGKPEFYIESLKDVAEMQGQRKLLDEIDANTEAIIQGEYDACAKIDIPYEEFRRLNKIDRERLIRQSAADTRIRVKDNEERQRRLDELHARTRKVEDYNQELLAQIRQLKSFPAISDKYDELMKLKHGNLSVEEVGLLMNRLVEIGIQIAGNANYIYQFMDKVGLNHNVAIEAAYQNPKTREHFIKMIGEALHRVKRDEQDTLDDTQMAPIYKGVENETEVTQQMGEQMKAARRSFVNIHQKQKGMNRQYNVSENELAPLLAKEDELKEMNLDTEPNRHNTIVDITSGNAEQELVEYIAEQKRLANRPDPRAPDEIEEY